MFMYRVLSLFAILSCLLSGSALASALPDCSNTSGPPYDKCFLTFTFGQDSEYETDQYIGEVLNNRWHGHGTYIYGSKSEWSGHRYIGAHRDGKRDGHGIYQFSDNDMFIGRFRKGKFEGFGVYLFTNGDMYIGDYENDIRSGVGAYIWKQGRIDMGEFADNVLNGDAIAVMTDGTIEEGVWQDDALISERDTVYSQNNSGRLPVCLRDPVDYGDDCFGMSVYDNGDRYVGDFRNGTHDGYGIFIFSESGNAAGDIYAGMHSNGIFKGFGTYIWADGRIDIGMFDDNQLNGYAIATYPNASVESGQWKDDERVESASFSNLPSTQTDQPDIGDTQPQKTAPDPDDDLQFAASGSGFAVSADGHLATNYHVIEGCEQVVLHDKGRHYPLTVVTFDPKNDLALLKADFSPAAVFALSNKRPELLQDIYVAGYPFGYELSSSVKVTKGIISSLTGIGNDYSNIQIDAALQSGNSGGPILDDYGNLVGVAVAKLNVEYLLEHFGDIPENTNFGVKANVLSGLLDSNGIPRLPANDQPINKSELAQQISNGTYYLSCWMTPAQIEAMADE